MLPMRSKDMILAIRLRLEVGKGDFRLKLEMGSHAWWEVGLGNRLLKALRCLFQQDYFA
jgi:hypothetical protein